MDLSFAVHKLVKFSSNSANLHIEGFVHLFRYIEDNKTLGLKYYADMEDAPFYDLIRHIPHLITTRRSEERRN